MNGRDEAGSFPKSTCFISYHLLNINYIQYGIRVV